MFVSWYSYHTLIYEFVFANVHFHITHFVFYVHKNTHTQHTPLSILTSVNLHFKQCLQHLKEQSVGERNSSAALADVCVCVTVSNSCAGPHAELPV